MLAFQEGGKPEYRNTPRKPSEQGENPHQTQPIYDTEPESNPGHIGVKASALTIAPILLHLYSLHYLLYEAEFLSLFLLRNALKRAKFQYVNHSIAKDSKSRISLALLINCFSFVFIFTQTIPTLTIHDRKFECPNHSPGDKVLSAS